MAATDEMAAVAAEVTPDQVTLVPEHPDEVTTTGGLDVARHQVVIASVVGRLQAAGVAVSLFIDATPDQVARVRATGATAVEINTGSYADAVPEGRTAELVRIQQAAQQAHEDGLEVLGGHGLTYVNVKPVAAVREIVELNIGHSIVSRAVLVGMDQAVREMVALIH